MTTTYDFEEDVGNHPFFIELMGDKNFCAQLWTAFANVSWVKSFDPALGDAENVMARLVTDPEERTWGASFRAMGGVIADLRNKYHNTSENYMDWYCSNMWYDDAGEQQSSDYGYVSEWVREAMLKMGWVPLEDEYYLESNNV